MKKSFALGLIIGALLMASTSAFATVGQKIEAYFSEYIIKVNGEEVDLEDSKIILKDGTTYLPVRKISNILGYDVTYLAESRTIVLSNATEQLKTAELNSLTVNQQDNNNDEWIKYTDLPIKYGLEVIGNKDGLSITNGEVNILIPTSDMNLIQDSGTTIKVNGQELRAIKEGNRVAFNIDDLRTLKLIP